MAVTKSRFCRFTFSEKMETFESEAAEGAQPLTDGATAALKQWFGVATEGMKRVQKKLEKRIKSK